MEEPKSSRLAVVKSRLSPPKWEQRVLQAEDSEAALERIAARIAAGASLNKALAKEVPLSRRSWVMRKWRLWKRDGLEALIDTRLPREPKLLRSSAGLIEVARMVNPEITVEEVVTILRDQGVQRLPSASTIRTHFDRVDRRQRYAKKVQEAAGKVVELPFAGGELLLAAELETMAIEALVDEVEALSAEALAASAGKTPTVDAKHRNKRGHFTAKYNLRRKRKRGQRVASYLAPAAQKAEGRVPSWPRFVHERRQTLEPKVRMLTFAPLVSSTKGWDALRAPEAAGLGSLTGFAYMPSTLAKMTSALAISNAGPRLLEAMGRNWHRVAQERWHEPGAMAALYVDNHAKEVWSSLFTQSGKVSHLSRVMPCITTTYVQTGAGAPVVALVQSGGAPLAPRLLQLVDEAEAKLQGEVRRAVVIDSEGSTFDILEAFAKQGRVIVTPLRPSRAPELTLSYTPGSYFRPYRDHDELRVATAILVHKSTGRSLELGALLLRREHRESDTVLLTTGLALGMAGRELADLYFARWAIQENYFKDGTAVGLAEHRGNSGQMVANVAVISEIERLQRRTSKAEDKQQQLDIEMVDLHETLLSAQRSQERALRAVAANETQLGVTLAQKRRDPEQLGKAAAKCDRALARADAARKALVSAQQAVNDNIADTLENDVLRKKTISRSTKLESQTTIRQLDVALDSILTATKLTLALLISFAIREYLSAMPMTPHTFISRIFGIRGRRELQTNQERIIFYENPRDPQVNAVLADACRRLNQRHLTRDGKPLQYVTEPPQE